MTDENHKSFVFLIDVTKYIYSSTLVVVQSCKEKVRQMSKIISIYQ